MTKSTDTSLDQLKRALDAGLIDQATFDAATMGISTQLTGSGAISQGQDALSVGAQGVVIDGNNLGSVNTGRNLAAEEGAQIRYAEQGASLVIGDAPVEMTAVDRQSIVGDLETELRERLRKELETPAARGRFASVRTLLTRGMSAEAVTQRRNAVNFTRRFEHNLDAYQAGQISFAEMDASVQGWINHVRYADTWGLREQIFTTHPIPIRKV